MLSIQWVISGGELIGKCRINDVSFSAHPLLQLVPVNRRCGTLLSAFTTVPGRETSYFQYGAFVIRRSGCFPDMSKIQLEWFVVVILYCTVEFHVYQRNLAIGSCTTPTVTSIVCLLISRHSLAAIGLHSGGTKEKKTKIHFYYILITSLWRNSFLSLNSVAPWRVSNTNFHCDRVFCYFIQNWLYMTWLM